MKTIISTVFLICTLSIGCGSDDAAKISLNEQLDTAKIIHDANIVESYSEIPDSLHDKLQTMTLAYIAFAGDCPNYVNLANKDSLGQFKEGYYIEPASEKLLIPEILRYSYNEFELTGILSKQYGLPKHFGFTDPHPQPGPIFTYYSYKVKRPYTFYGPNYKMIDLLGDTVKLASHIQVR